LQKDVIVVFVELCADQLHALQKMLGSEVLAFLQAVLDQLMHIPVNVFKRPQREQLLDVLCTLRMPKKSVQSPVVQSCLPLIIRLLELPNMTAKISTDPAVLVQLAASVGDSSVAAVLLDETISLVLKHLVATQDQERSQTMLVSLSGIVAEYINNIEGKKMPSHSNALLGPVFRSLEGAATEGLKQRLPHREPSAIKVLVNALSKRIRTSVKLIDGDDISVEALQSLQAALKTLLDVPISLIEAAGLEMAGLLAALAGLLEARLEKESSDEKSLSTTDIATLLNTVLVRSYEVIAKFAPATPNVHLALFADKLLQLAPQPSEHAVVLKAFEAFVQQAEFPRRELILNVLESTTEVPASSLLLVHASIAKIEKNEFLETEGSSPSVILCQLLKLATSSQTLTTRRRSMLCLTKILKEKPFMVNQFTVEATLQTLHTIAQARIASTILYLDLCNVLSALLLHHRSRLQGRFHSVIKLFQALVTRLFKPTRPASSKDNQSRQLTPKHSHALSRLLTLFCEPPQHRKHAKAGLEVTSLVDETRKEQAHVGRFVQYILHHYCTQILHGTLGEGVKDALTPGLWAMTEAMEINGAEGVKVLSAAMNNSERAVLRGLYDEWRRFGKWRGG